MKPLQRFVPSASPSLDHEPERKNIKRFPLRASLTLTALACAALLASQARADQPANVGLLPLATGQTVTAAFVPGAVQRYLNPQLLAYPNFVAGEAVRSQLSPDGTTLAVLCAGQNSLYDTAGKVDAGNSTPVTTPVPEPGTFALMALGFGTLTLGPTMRRL